MLVISRKAGEKICLGDDVVITVLELSGSVVRLGVEAPARVPLDPDQQLNAMRVENPAPAEASKDLPRSSPHT
jgi:carbon storage regulator